jgi:3-dehydroquinate synthase
MRTIRAELGANSHNIYIGPGILGNTTFLLKETGLSGKVVIVTDPVIDGLYGQDLKRGLIQAGYKVTTLLVPRGEDNKSLETAGRLYHDLTDNYADRTTSILALGGGVIGDLAGFVASTYMRGVPFIQVPTTLLAQVDSSIGGKVAVDHGQIKNKVGAFYQPRLIISDTETLKTLPSCEMANGMAEVIKSAAIRNERFFAFLEDNLASIKDLDLPCLEETVFQTAKIKAEIVEKDERELGLRAILNYGHTIGHAIETVSELAIEHGKAVAFGMIAAARISHKMGILDYAGLNRLRELVGKADLPTQMPRMDKVATMQALKHDKKIRNDKIRFVLLKAIGDAFIADNVDLSLVEEVLEASET